MSKNDKFVKFLEKSSIKDEEIFDPDREIQEWLKYLDELYENFQTCLTSYEADANISWSFKEIALSEESLGIYVVKRATLEMGSLKYIFDPIGTMFIGSKGRVDVRGPSKVGMLALVQGSGPSVTVKVKVLDAKEGEGDTLIDRPLPASDKNREWKWKIVNRVGSRVEYVDLDELTITNFLIDLA